MKQSRGGGRVMGRNEMTDDEKWRREVREWFEWDLKRWLRKLPPKRRATLEAEARARFERDEARVDAFLGR